MNISSPIKMHDYPAEYACFSQAGDFWAIDAGADLLILDGEKLLNSYFLPGMLHWPLMIKPDKKFYRGTFYGNIGSPHPGSYSPDFKVVYNAGKQVSLVGYVFQQIIWHPQKPVFAGSMKQFIPRNGSQNGSSISDYPLVIFDAAANETRLLQRENLPVDAMTFSENWMAVFQKELSIYDSNFSLAKKIPNFVSNTQVDSLIIFENEKKLLWLNAIGMVKILSLPAGGFISEFELPGYQTQQPIAISYNGFLITGNNNGELIFYNLNGKTNDIAASKKFDGMITSVAAHPSKNLVALGINGTVDQGTYWISWT